jgi:hypothetical protein
LGLLGLLQGLFLHRSRDVLLIRLLLGVLWMRLVTLLLLLGGELLLLELELLLGEHHLLASG